MTIPKETLHYTVQLVRYFLNAVSNDVRVSPHGKVLFAKRFMFIPVMAGVNVKAARLSKMTEDLDLYVNSMLSQQGVDVRILLSPNPLGFEIVYPREVLTPSRKIPLPPLGMGYAIQGNRLVGVPLPLSGQDAHAIVVAATGGGKSVLMQNIIANTIQARPADWYMLDMKNAALRPFLNHPKVTASAVRPDDAFTIIEGVVKGMYEHIRRGRKHKRPQILVIDELSVILANKEANQMMADILRLGREVRIHVIAAQQDLLKATFPAKNNFTVRVVGPVTSPSEAHTAAGISGTQAHRLCTGVFVLIHDGRWKRIYVPYLEVAGAGLRS